MIITLLIFAGSILLLIGFHELGHFLAAKAFGVYVIEFAIGFGPRLAMVRGKETRYSIRAIPFGGYVRMAGEDRRETDDAIPAERLLYSKSPGVRAVISLAGPVANLLLSLAVTLAVVWSVSFPVVQVADVIEETPAAEALLPGDRVLAIDGRDIYLVDQITESIQRSGGREMAVTIRRGGMVKTIGIAPAYAEDEQRYVVGAYFHSIAYTNELSSISAGSYLETLGLRNGDIVSQVGETNVGSAVALLVELDAYPDPTVLTILRDGGRLEVPVSVPTQAVEELSTLLPFTDLGVASRHTGFVDGLILGLGQFADYASMIADFARQIVTGRIAATEALQGPIGVARILGQSFRLGPAVFFQILAFLSLNFALLNLIPFPGLDGSRVGFALYEKIRGRPIPVEREGLIHAVGFAILIALMILITYKDLVALFR